MAEPIRVAQIIGKVVQGGVDTLIMNYYRNIDRSKVQFDFFMDGFETTIYDDEIRSLGGKVFKLPPYERGMLKNLRAFKGLLEANKYQIIHSHMNSLSVFWLREAKKAGIPIRIAHSHSTASMSEGVRTLLKYLLIPFSKAYPTHFAACSEYAAAWLFGKKTLNSGSVFILRNAIDLDRFVFNQEIRGTVREKLNISERFVIGHVGRFVYQKNHKFLVNLFKEIHKGNPSAMLVLIGEGELKKGIEDLAASHGLTESILFLGNRGDVHELFQAMDLFLLPSYYEGLPVVAVEAQAAGLPCILSDRITDEIILSDNIKLLPIKGSLDRWVKQFYEFKDKERNSGQNSLISGGYGIKHAAPGLCRYYTLSVH